MNDDLKKDKSADNNATPPSKPANQENQSKRQPADEEIGDYADPNAIQVDGGDNSFIADEPGEASAPKKKPGAA